MTLARRSEPGWIGRAGAVITLAMALIWSGAAAALPSNPTVVGSSGANPTFNTGPSSLTVGQTSSRVVIDWQSFNIAHGETVTFTQPNTQAIAFNIVGPGVQTTISGNLTATGGVWLLSPGGVIFGSGAVVNTGSFLASTGNFTAASVTEALNSNTIEIFPQSTVGVGSISVDPAASITANAGFVALQAPTIDAEGSITATDGVVLNALEGMQLTVSPGASGVLLASETPTAPNGGSSNITAGGTISAAWVELDAFNNSTTTPGVSGIINLTGHITATGVSPSSGDGVDLFADFGSTDPSDLVTTINASGGQITSAGTISASAGTVNLGAWTTTNAGFGYITVGAGPGGVTASQPLTTNSGADIDLTATGPVSVTAPLTSTGSVTLDGDTVSLGAGADVSAYYNINLNAPDGVASDPKSSLTAVDSFGNPGSVDIQVGSTNGPANLTTGQINAGAITLVSNDNLTQPAGGVSSGPGNITIGGAVTTGANGSLFIDSYLGVAINAPIDAQGATGVSLYTNQGGSGGDYSFGVGGSLSFTGTPNSGQSLVINGAGYTLVYSLSDLLGINNNLGGDYALANSLDLANLTSAANPQGAFFTASPIANTSSPEGGEFYGVFTGLGHTIANLSIDQTVAGPGYFSSGEVGLFGVVGYGGVVRDVNLTNAQVTGGDGMDVGGLVGWLNGTVQNVSVSGVVTGGQGGAYQGIGGLVGDENNGALVLNSHASAQVIGGDNAWVGGLVGALTNGGVIQSSYATGAVSTGDSFGSGAAGGLVGGTYAYPYSSGLTPNTISDSYATGAVTGGAGTQVGGFIGDAVATNITTSYATGQVTQTASNGNPDQAGGFVGFLGGDSTITQSYASGAVSSTGATGDNNAVGGFVGAMQDNATISDSYALGAVASSNDSYVGGFAGILSANLGGPGNPSIERVYATGAVTDTAATKLTGGLVGQLTAGSISDSF